YKIKGLTGETPSNFFRTYKLNRAAELLKGGKHTAIFYNSKGDGYLVQADSGGDIFLIDGRTGRQLDKISPTKNGSNFEASPALFGNMLVVGSRGDQTIFFIRLS
ncbi:MAG: hypothetical protein IJR81_02980, partial [Clostridia bacterium]|nr:hypothetical protein [Clostridia bacterium]